VLGVDPAPTHQAGVRLFDGFGLRGLAARFNRIGDQTGPELLTESCLVKAISCPFEWFSRRGNPQHLIRVSAQHRAPAQWHTSAVEDKTVDVRKSAA